MSDHRIVISFNCPGDDGNSCYILQLFDMTFMIPCGKTHVIYWPSTEPSIKRCTCVNKRKNYRSRWAIDSNITRCPDGSRQSETGCQRENQLADWRLWAISYPQLSNPSQDAKELLLWLRKNLGQYNSPSLSLIISHTQQTSPFQK